MPISVLFAATYPERADALILVGGYARGTVSEDYAWGLAPDLVDPLMQTVEQSFGTGADADWFVPSTDDAFRAWWNRFKRASVTPAALIEAFRMGFAMDIRPVLPVVQAKTLVMHSTDDRMTDVEQGRYLAEHLPDWHLVELPGADHFPWTSGVMANEIERFLTGTHRPVETDRVLATVLFTDLVASTERAADIGDRKWRELLESHHSAVRQELDRFRGNEVKTTGDGFLATFDGPARAVRCALEVREKLQLLGLPVRSGIHTGECEVGEDDISGIAVHIGSRVANLATSGEVLVSSTVRDLVTGSDIEFSDRGMHALKGLPDPWHLYEAVRASAY